MEAFEQSQSKSGKSQRSKNYTILEDQALVQAWSAVSPDACTGTNQTAKRYWQWIEDQYFCIMTNYPNKTPRTFRSLQGRWENIKPMCSRWVACLEQVCNAPPSGTVESDYVSLFCLCSVRELEQAPEVDSVVVMNFNMDSMAWSEDRPS